MTELVTWVVGDIHGSFIELSQLVAVCGELETSSNLRFVFLGDYIDRGPDSRRVVEFLRDRQQEEMSRYICLRGNHEALLIKAASRNRTNRDLLNWLANGGVQTLESYEVDDPVDLPEAHLAWIKGLPLQFADELRLYVHAGVRPGVPLADQVENDLLWIREPFLSSAEPFGPLIVHGHTPTDSGLPDLRENRLNLDTGACFGCELTAALFTSGEVGPRLYVNSAGLVWDPSSEPDLCQ